MGGGWAKPPLSPTKPPAKTRYEARPWLATALAAKFGAERIVPVVGDLAHGLEQILELFVVEPREAPERTDDHFVAVRVDGERRVRRGEERQLEQAPVERLAAGRG